MKLFGKKVENTFKLKNLKIGVEKAQLFGVVDFTQKSIKFAVNIKMEEGELSYDDDEEEGEAVKPALACDELYIDETDWKALENRTLNYKDLCYPNLSVVEEEDVTDGKMKFGKITGNEIEFSWKGKGNVGWDEELGEDVPFEFNGKLEYVGILVYSSIEDKEELIENLSPILDTDGYDFVKGDEVWKLTPKA